MLTAMGAEGFAERARRELLATGETVRKRTVETTGELTAQEGADRLAGPRRASRTPEISTQLFISPRTVEWHLRKVFTKLDISSRRQLRVALPERTSACCNLTPALADVADAGPGRGARARIPTGATGPPAAPRCLYKLRRPPLPDSMSVAPYPI